jgi:ubiquinone/menaquinone biosynthesis C-methylase UbiE
MLKMNERKSFYRQPINNKNRNKERFEDRFNHLKKILVDNDTNVEQISKKINTIVDIGAGNTQLTLEFCRKLNVNNVYVIDRYSEERFVDLREKGDNFNIKYIQSSDTYIELKDNICDFLIAFVVIHHVDDIPNLISEIKRILKPGGMVFVREHDVTTNREVEYIDKVHLKFGKEHSSGKTNYVSKKELVSYFESYGFVLMGSSTYNCYNPQKLYHSLYYLSE